MSDTNEGKATNWYPAFIKRTKQPVTVVGEDGNYWRVLVAKIPMPSVNPFNLQHKFTELFVNKRNITRSLKATKQKVSFKATPVPTTAGA